jgi:hypothetical protein
MRAGGMRTKLPAVVFFRKRGLGLTARLQIGYDVGNDLTTSARVKFSGKPGERGISTI